MRISASFDHDSRRDNLSSDTARETIRKISFKPTSRRSSHVRPGRHLAAALQIRTISHQNPADDDRAAFAELRAFLERTYPKVHAAIGHEIINGDALLYRWEGTDSALPPILFLAHQDVVPIEPGTESKWTHPPFDGVVADGFIWGRGAIDDKSSLIAILEAGERLAMSRYQPARTIMFALGQDEEAGGVGNATIAKALMQRGVRFAWVLDEFSPILQEPYPGVRQPIATIGVAEKGYLTLELTAHGTGGHSAMPTSSIRPRTSTR